MSTDKPFRPPKQEPPELETIEAEPQKQLRELSHRIRQVQEAKAALVKEADKIKAQEGMLKAKLLEVMDSLQMQSFKMKGVGLVYVHASPKISVLKADKPEVMKWLKENGHGDIVKEDVNASTLKAFVVGLREEGFPLPPLIREYLHREPRFKA